MKKIDEIEALKIIYETLSDLAIEEKQKIFAFLSSKHALNKAISIGFNSNEQVTQLISPSNQVEQTRDVKQFLASKKPIGFYEQITCLAYFLEKAQGYDGFNFADINQANSLARGTKFPKNSQAFSDSASKYGYLTSVGDGKKAITARGEALVDALPDREAVKLALEEYPIKRKSAPKPNKKAEK